MRSPWYQHVSFGSGDYHRQTRVPPQEMLAPGEATPWVNISRLLYTGSDTNFSLMEGVEGWVVPLANWTGAPLASITVTIDAGRAFGPIESAHHGVLVARPDASGRATITLPLESTDVVYTRWADRTPAAPEIAVSYADRGHDLRADCLGCPATVQLAFAPRWTRAANARVGGDRGCAPKGQCLLSAHSIQLNSRRRSDAV